MALTRISITLPPEVLQAADKRARALDRSRSWLIVAAIRTYLATAPAQVREVAGPVSGAQEVADARRQHLASDLRRTPAERHPRGGRHAAIPQPSQQDRGPAAGRGPRRATGGAAADQGGPTTRSRHWRTEA